MCLSGIVEGKLLSDFTMAFEANDFHVSVSSFYFVSVSVFRVRDRLIHKFARPGRNTNTVHPSRARLFDSTVFRPPSTVFFSTITSTSHDLDFIQHNP
jgi:hypothetical protein